MQQRLLLLNLRVRVHDLSNYQKSFHLYVWRRNTSLLLCPAQTILPPLPHETAFPCAECLSLSWTLLIPWRIPERRDGPAGHSSSILRTRWVCRSPAAESNATCFDGVENGE